MECLICAIFGFVSNPNQPQDGKELYKLAKHLAVEASIRGRDSTGVAVIRQNKRFIDKRAVAPVIFYDKYADRLERLVSDKQFEYFIGHDRFATCARISNECAHPFFNKRYVVVHNGYYYNEHEIRRTFGIDNPTGVDSELILSFVAKFGVERLNLFLEVAEGPSAIAVHDRESQKLFLVRDSNPTSFAHHNGGLIFASTESILVDAVEAAHGIKIPTSQVRSTLPYTLYSCHFDGAQLEREQDWEYLRETKSYSRYSGYGSYHGYYGDDYYDSGYNKKESTKSTHTPNKSAKDSAEVFTEKEKAEALEAELVEVLAEEKARKCENCDSNMDFLYESVWYCMDCTLTVDDNFVEKFFIDKNGKKIDYHTKEEAVEDDSIDWEKTLVKQEAAPGFFSWEDKNGEIVRISSPEMVINNPSEDEVINFLVLAENSVVKRAVEKDDNKDRPTVH